MATTSSSAAAGATVLVGDGTATGSGGAALTGGDEEVVGGAGADSLTGDGSVASDGAGPLALAGGADTFVFGMRDGQDVVTDFRATLLAWDALDSDGSGFLDDGDACVAVAAGDTRIDLGLATGAVAERGRSGSMPGTSSSSEGATVLPAATALAGGLPRAHGTWPSRPRGGRGSGVEGAHRHQPSPGRAGGRGGRGGRRRASG